MRGKIEPLARGEYASGDSSGGEPDGGYRRRKTARIALMMLTKSLNKLSMITSLLQL